MKRAISILLSVSMIMGLFTTLSISASAEEYKWFDEKIEGGELSGYVVKGDTATISIFRSDGSTKELVLPETLGGYTITSINSSSFHNSKFTKITLPAKLTSISEYCFSDSKVETFVLPETFVNIGDNAFSYCKNLKTIDLSNVKTIGKSSFSSCSSLSEVILSDNLTEIGDNAFQNCESLKNFTIPKNVNKVGTKLFMNDTALKEIKVSEDSQYFATVDGVLYNKNMTRLYEYPEGKSGNSFTVPEGVKTIAPKAFKNTKKLKTLGLPESLEKIGEEAMSISKIETVSFSGNPVVLGASCFWGCEKMASVDLKGVTQIGTSAFERCDLLSDVKLPDTLTVIGKKAFAHCNSLETITIPKNVEKMGSLVFSDAYYSILKSIKVDKDNKYFASKDGVLFTKDMTELITYPRNKAGKVYKIPDSVKVVRSVAFQYAKNLEKVVFSKSIKEVRKNVFKECSSLKTIDLGDGMTNWNFACTQGSVRTVIIGKKLKTISSHNDFFVGCAKVKNFKVRKGNKYFTSKGGALLSKDLKHYYRYPGARRVDKYRIPDTVKVIEPCAFSNIHTVNKIVMPDSVTKVKKEAFRVCSIQSIRLSKKLTEISDSCFAGANLRKINIPSSVKRIGKNAFDYCTAMKPVKLHEGLKEVDDEAFLYCSTLNSITIPKSVKKIGEHAFGYRDAWSWGEEDEDGNYSGDTRYFIHRHSYLIRGYKGSEAERYAKKNNIKFKKI